MRVKVVVILMVLGLLAGCASPQPAASNPSTGGSTPAAATPNAGGQPTAAASDGVQLAAATPDAGGSLPAGTPPGGGPFGPQGSTEQLALETLYLQTTQYPISAEQASVLLPYWNQIKALQESATADSTQIDALVSQIDTALTADQQSLLAGLAQQDLMTWAQGQGLIGGGGFGPGGTPGAAMPTPSDDERATAQADRPQGQGAPGGRFGSANLDAVITMLEGLSS